jgi:exonuclease SbcD
VFFPSKSPETQVIDELGVAIHGQSFAKAAITEDLSAGYPSAQRGMFNIGLLHTSAAGYSSHERYAPCTLEGLRLKGYDYWALGHVHQREILSDEPHIAFSGNIQGRHIRETGPKGCLLVTVADDYSVETEFCPLDVLRWEECKIDLSKVEHHDDALAAVSTELQNIYTKSEGRQLVVRVIAEGATKLHGDLLADRHRWMQEVRGQAIDVGGDDIWVEKVKLRTQPASLQHDLNMSPDSPIGQLQSLVQELRDQTIDLQELNVDFKDLLNKLPDELRGSNDFEDPAWQRSILDEAEQRLIRTLREKGRA